MIPQESALFSRGCMLTSLWGRLMSAHCEGFCTSGAVVCPLRVAPERCSGGYGTVKNYLFLSTFMWFFSEKSTKSDRNSTTEKSVAFSCLRPGARNVRGPSNAIKNRSEE